MESVLSGGGDIFHYTANKLKHRNGEMGMVARRQADFLYDGKRWYLRDNESSNGTFINGERIEPDIKYHLHYGDEVRFAFCEKIIIRKKL